MAAPGDAGAALARSMGVYLEPGRKSIPDFTQYPDPLAGIMP